MPILQLCKEGNRLPGRHAIGMAKAGCITGSRRTMAKIVSKKLGAQGLWSKARG